jgi:hypothetical protein
VLVAAVVVLARRRQWAEFTYVGLTAASLLTSTYYLSVPRTLLVCFPLIMLVARWPLGRIWQRGAIAIGVSLLAVNTTTFLTGHWTG